MASAPDSIEPVVGWKTFAFEKGILSSPNYSLAWTKQGNTKALCPMHFTHYRWVISDEPPPRDDTQASSDPLFIHPVLIAGPPIPSCPDIVLPPGKYWRLEQNTTSHLAPDNDCSCGIYLAKTADRAVGYGQVLAQVKGWGKVIEHEDGWRVENAYPSHLYAITMEEALVLAEYGVPVTLIEDIKDQSVQIAAICARPEAMLAPPRWLRRVVRFSPFLLLGLMALQWGLVLHNPTPVGTGALVLSSAAAALLFAMIKPWKPWP